MTAWAAAAGVAALLTLAPAANAALYCCDDAHGKKVCADRMPTACVGRDTTLKNERGTSRISGMLTPEQRALREEEEAQKKREIEEKLEKRRQDLALLNTYANTSDIDRARERAEKDVQAQIAAAEKKIADAAAKKKKFDTEAEFYKGKSLPEDLRRSLKDLEFEVKAQGDLIENKKKELAGLQAKYDADKKRYEELQKAKLKPR